MKKFHKMEFAHPVFRHTLFPMEFANNKLFWYLIVWILISLIKYAVLVRRVTILKAIFVLKFSHNVQISTCKQKDVLVVWKAFTFTHQDYANFYLQIVDLLPHLDSVLFVHRDMNWKEEFVHKFVLLYKIVNKLITAIGNASSVRTDFI